MLKDNKTKMTWNNLRISLTLYMYFSYYILLHDFLNDKNEPSLRWDLRTNVLVLKADWLWYSKWMNIIPRLYEPWVHVLFRVLYTHAVRPSVYNVNIDLFVRWVTSAYEGIKRFHFLEFFLWKEQVTSLN